MVRAFILQPTYRIESGRAVVLLYGMLEGGGSCLIRDDRTRPHFWIREADRERLPAAALRVGEPAAAADRRSFDGSPLLRISTARPQELPSLRERLEAAAIECFEADVRLPYRYMIERGLRGTIEIVGEAQAAEGVDARYINPEVSAADWTPEPRWLSIDIETDPRATELLSIALAGCGAEEVLLWHPDGGALPPNAIGFRSVEALLKAFVARVDELDPDVITGWNVVDFDLAVLRRIASSHRVRLTLGRGSGELQLRGSGFGGGQIASVPGRVFLDGIQLLRGAFVKLRSYSLNNAAQEILGRRKLIQGSDRGQAILRAFREDRETFVRYNLLDAQLVLEILDKLQIPQLTVQRSRLTGMPLDRVSASIASFDQLYLAQLSRRGIAAPSVRAGDDAAIHAGGGHVLEPRAGLHDNVLIFDFKSLYPSLIRTFEIDPLGYVAEPEAGDDLILAPNGAAFRRGHGILPQLLDELFPRREEARRRGDKVASQAIKILMNSFYGVLGTSACRFASEALANAITSFGRETLLWGKRNFEQRGLEVLYGDTDSLFVSSGLGSPEHARELGEELVRALNDDLSRHLRERWNVESKLELEFERLYLKLLLPRARSGGAARKRYAGLIEEQGERRTVFTGMEVVRRDWTKLARDVQRQLYDDLFHDRPCEIFLRETARRLRAGELDASLVYRKALRKRLEEYEASAPHVVAARKLGGKPPRVVSYVITDRGAEPVQQVRGRLDHEHYLQRQLRPVAEPVLELLGLDFDRVIGDDAQLSLF